MTAQTALQNNPPSPSPATCAPRRKGGIRGGDGLGISLVEVLVSLVVLLIVFFGLIQASVVSIDSSMKNVIRDEAVRIASDTMATTKAISFTALAVTVGCEALVPALPPRNFRNFSIQYNICREVSDLDAENKIIRIETTWDWKGETYTHSIESIRRQ